MAQVADARARDREREYARAVGGGARERDRGERDRGDRADAGGQAVHAVDEVDHVHERHDPDNGERVRERGAERDRADERDRHLLDPHARRHGGDRGEQLADELEVGRELEHVVERADERDHARADEDPGALVRPGEEHPDRRGDRHEDREPAEPRRRVLVEAALARAVDRADPPRERCRDWSGEDADHHGEPEGE